MEEYIVKESSLQFKRPRVKKFIFIENNDFKQEEFNGFKINSSIDVYKSQDNNSAMVELTLMIGESVATVPFTVEAVIWSVFKWKDDMENIDRMLNQNAPALLLSYLRPIVSNAVSNAGMPPFDIPFMDFTEDGK